MADFGVYTDAAEKISAALARLQVTQGGEDWLPTGNFVGSKLGKRGNLRKVASALRGEG